MKLNIPKTRTFWVAVGIAAFSIVLYIVHIAVANFPYVGGLGYVFLLAAFILLILDILIK